MRYVGKGSSTAARDKYEILDMLANIGATMSPGRVGRYKGEPAASLPISARPPEAEVNS